MYKLVAMDIDGTLLNSYGEITEENKEAIQNAIKKGTEVVLASGRIIGSIKTIANEIGASNYLISGNGALIYDIRNEKIVYSNYISKQKILEIIKICDENSIFYTISKEDTIITKSLNYNILFYNSENLKNPPDKKININVVTNIYEYIENYQGNDFLKITICDSDKIVFFRILEKLKKIKNVDILDISHISRKNIKSGTEELEIAYYYTEITNKDVDKWTAIEHLANILNVNKEEIITIGDNANDEKMIKNAGMGIAMENGSEQLKKQAKYITKTNDNSGVADALNKYIN
jgi:Cof subfamily protein (haloacid dehalogenase superfamily)